MSKPQYIHADRPIESNINGSKPQYKTMDQQQLTSHQFGATASHYLTSAVHATGADLDRLTNLAAALHAPRILDVGAGAGHASFALARGGARKVVAYDLST